jgi:hypothetical protein
MNEELSALSYDDFVRARNLHRLQEANKSASAGIVPRLDEAPPKDADDSHFMLHAPGPEGIFAVFEDSMDGGWFYLYGVKEGKILKGIQIYDAANVDLTEDVVDFGWAIDGSACGLAIWGRFRAFLGAAQDLVLRKPLRNADEDGIPSGEWPAGFDHFLDVKID